VKEFDRIILILQIHILSFENKMKKDKINRIIKNYQVIYEKFKKKV